MADGLRGIFIGGGGGVVGAIDLLVVIHFNWKLISSLKWTEAPEDGAPGQHTPSIA